VRRVRLPNGLTVLLREMRQAPLVSIWCWYRVGSRDERPGFTGITHWVEHMNFKGTRTIPKSEVTRRVELAGGTWNGYTYLDVTTYFETVQKDAMEEMLRLEASRMSECLYPKAEVERERNVVISELQGGENDPRSFLDKEVTGTALQAHPYRWPTIGYLSDLKAIDRDDLYRHYRTYYVPNNAVLALAGDFRGAEALRAVRRLFGPIRRGASIPRIRTVEPEQSGERRVVLRRPSGAAYLDVAWPAPAAADPDFPALLVLDGVLLGGPSVNIWAGHSGRGPSKSSRLYRALVDGDLASAVGSTLIPTTYPFLYRVTATAREGVDPQRIEIALLAEIERLARGDVGARDLERARNQFLARYALDCESVTNVAHQIGFFETVTDHRLLLDLPGRVLAVQAADVARLARERLSSMRRTVGHLVPSDDTPAPAERTE
jgi:zinc protease